MSEPGSPEQRQEQRLDFIIRELDDFCGIARNGEQVDHNAIGQIMLRSQLIASFLLARQPAKFKVISNG